VYCVDDFLVLNSPIIFDLLIYRFPKFTRIKVTILTTQSFI